MKALIAALALALIEGVSTAHGAYRSGSLALLGSEVLLVMAGQAFLIGLLGYGSGRILFLLLRIPAVVSFLLSGLLVAFATPLTLRLLHPQAAPPFSAYDALAALAAGFVIGGVCFAAHVLMPNYAFKRTAGTGRRVS